MKTFVMRVVEADVVELEFKEEGHLCRHRVDWKPFCDAVLIADFASRHGEEALQRLVDQLGTEGVETCPPQRSA